MSEENKEQAPQVKGLFKGPSLKAQKKKALPIPKPKSRQPPKGPHGPATNTSNKSTVKSKEVPKTIYEQALHGGKGKKGGKRRSIGSKEDLEGSQPLSQVIEGEDAHFKLYESTIYQMKDHLKSLQLKDAIDRSNFLKLDRENKDLKEKFLRYSGDLSKSEKQRNNDGNYIIKQEELIAKMQLNKKTKTVGDKNGLKEEYEQLVRENNKLKEDIMELKQLESKNNPIAHYEQSSQLLNKIKKALNGETHMLPGLFMNQLHLYETNLKLQTQETKIFGEYIQTSNDKLKNQRILFDKKVKMLKKERITDQKRILDLQRRLGYLEEEVNVDKTKLMKNSNVMGMDINWEETYARGKVDDILGRLKGKLVDIEEKNMETQKFINRLAVIGPPQTSGELEQTLQSNKLSIIPTEAYLLE